MPIEKERVQPAPFESAAPRGQSDEKRDPGGPGPARWILPALAGLVLLVLAVVFWLPSALQPDNSEVDAAQTPVDAESATQGKPAPPGAAPQSPVAGTPFADAEAARLRGEAQDILEDLLDLRDSLTRRGAEIWASDALAAVNTAAA